MKCFTCDKPLDGEKTVLVFKSVPAEIGWCEEHMMSDEATKILAGLAERKREDGW